MKYKTEDSGIQTSSRVSTDGENSISDDQDPDEIMKRDRIKFITKLLIDSKYGLMDDVNYNRGLTELKDQVGMTENGVGPVVNEVPPGSFADQPHNHISLIPRSTKIQADRVRIYLDNYYSKLEGSISIENSEHLHEGVEGVYNPLQVIRNRKIKKKYNEMPPRQLSMQKPPLIAILEFSKKPHKKMPWFVDVAERASDLTWRTSHWDELRDPQGNLWFGNKGNAYDSVSPADGQHKHKHEHKHHRHHIHRPHHIPRSNRRPSGSQDTVVDDHIKGFPEPPKIFIGSEMGSNEKEDNNHLVPHETIDQDSISGDSDRSRFNRFEMMIGKKPRWSKSPSSRRKSHGSVDKLSVPLNHSKSASIGSRTLRHSPASTSSVLTNHGSSVPASSIAATDSQSQRSNLLSAIPIQRARNITQDQSDAEVAVEDEEDEVDPLQPVESGRQVDEQLQKYRSDARYMMCTFRVLKHRKMTDDLIRKRYVQSKCKPQQDEDMSLIINKTSKMLHTYDAELDKALEKGNNYASSLLNDYSMRVETLISTTDRILSDINTTLTLKLKVFQENADRFGTLRLMKSQKLTKFLYRMLEFGIVMVCWSIWLVVSVVKYIKFAFVFTLKLLKWMLW